MGMLWGLEKRENEQLTPKAWDPTTAHVVGEAGTCQIPGETPRKHLAQTRSMVRMITDFTCPIFNFREIAGDKTHTF